MDLNYAAAAPEIVLGLSICLVLLADVFLRDDQRNITYVLSMLVLIAVAATAALLPVTSEVVTFNGAYVTDPAAAVLKMVACVTLGVTFLYSREYLENNGLLKGEFFVLGLFGLLGVMIMVSAHSLLTLYLGVEVLSFSLYIAVSLGKNDPRSGEAGLKYVLLGGVASAMLLYGLSLLYGVAGSTQYADIAGALSMDTEAVRAPLLLALTLIVCGLGFKGAKVKARNVVLVGIRDLDGDGKSDIIWRKTNGELATWLMNGFTLVGAPYYGTVSTDWVIAGSGDFDGDGRSDILWRNISGAVGYWAMNGSAILSMPILGSAP